MRGAISAGWRRGDGTFELDVAVPPNTRATVRIPKLGRGGSVDRLGGRRATVWNATAGPSAGSSRHRPGREMMTEAVVFDVGSGDYCIHVETERVGSDS